MRRSGSMMTGAALILATAAQWTAPMPARAQGLPPGSWIQTCQVKSIDTVKGELVGYCKPKVSCPIFAGCDLAFPVTSTLFYRECLTEIVNNDGYLTCTPDQAKVAARIRADAAAAGRAAEAQARIDIAQQVAAARPGMQAAAVLVLGTELGNEPLEKLVMVGRQVNYPAARAAIVAQQFDFGEASRFLKTYLARAGGEKYRDAAVELAFIQVYGRPSTPAEQVRYYADISAGKAWYATIVGDQMKLITPGADARRGVVERAAQAGFGRSPTDAERTAWLGNNRTYAGTLEGVRQTMWSPTGATELVETIKRALAKLSYPTDDTTIKAAIKAWRPMRATYAEMVGPIGKAKLRPERS